MKKLPRVVSHLIANAVMWQKSIPPFEFQTDGYETLRICAVKCWQPKSLFLIRKTQKPPKEKLVIYSIFVSPAKDFWHKKLPSLSLSDWATTSGIIFISSILDSCRQFLFSLFCLDSVWWYCSGYNLGNVKRQRESYWDWRRWVRLLA